MLYFVWAFQKKLRVIKIHLARNLFSSSSPVAAGSVAVVMPILPITAATTATMAPPGPDRNAAGASRSFYESPLAMSVVLIFQFIF